MRVLQEQDYELLKLLINRDQDELIKTLGHYFEKHYSKIIKTKKYLVAIGDIPIALVAHMDTVFDNCSNSYKELYYDQRLGVLFCPDGAGFDDKAGIYAILQVVRSGLRPSIILTTDEERGGLGAQALSNSPCPIPNLKYLIQLDRRGSDDCVFYDCDCPEFIDYIESFGFTERIGSFSDISFLMPKWDICGVNLSVGYENEHTTSEILYINTLLVTIEKVKKMLAEKDIPDFTYTTLVHPYQNFYKKEYAIAPPLGMSCSKCGKHYFDFELIPVKSADGGKMKYYCADCVADRVNWCDNCGHAYEIGDPDEDMCLCKDCIQEVLKSAEND